MWGHDGDYYLQDLLFVSAQTGGCVKYCRMRVATPLVITSCVVVATAALASLALLIVSIAVFAVEEPRKIPEQND
jgi:hypothetical protein